MKTILLIVKLLVILAVIGIILAGLEKLFNFFFPFIRFVFSWIIIFIVVLFFLEKTSR